MTDSPTTKENLYNLACDMLGNWREWAEHRHLTADEFAAMLGRSDEIYEKLLDKAVAFERQADEPRAGMDTPWPLHDVLAQLIAAAEHLLVYHGCDTHGHENYRAAVEAAKRLLPETKEGSAS